MANTRVSLDWAIQQIEHAGWIFIRHKSRDSHTCLFRFPDGTESWVRVHAVGTQFGDSEHWFAIRPDTFQTTAFHTFLSQSQDYLLMVPNSVLSRTRNSLDAPSDLIGGRNKEPRWNVRVSFGYERGAAFLRPDWSTLAVDVSLYRFRIPTGSQAQV